VPNQSADNLENRVFDLETELESKQQETQDLANIASVITSILDIESVLAAAMEIGIRQVSGEVGAIVLADDTGPSVRISWGVESDVIRSLKYGDNELLLEYALRHKQSVLDNSCRYAGDAGVSVRNAIIAPIISKGEAIGAIVALNREGNGDFTAEDICRLEMIGKFTSIALDNATLFQESLAKQRLEQELDLARQVQETLLPDTFDMKGLRIEAMYIPARQVGGDYYDLIPISDNKLLFVIGDVTSKGAPAALMMTSVYSIVRSEIMSGGPVEVTRLMAHLNDVLCRDIIKTHDMFITLFMAYLDIEAGILEFCNGGHPPPFYYRADTGETVRLKSGGPLAGQFPNTEYTSSRIEIHPGDRIFCYTDGLIEASRRDGAMFGMARLEEFFTNNRRMATKDFMEAVKKEIDDFSSEADRDTFDDYTTITIDVLSSPPAGKRHDLVYDSRLENLERMYADFSRICREHGISVDDEGRLLVAVSEAMTNAIIHAHGGDTSKLIRIAVDVYDKRIEIRIADEGDGPAWDKAMNFDPVGTPEDESGRGFGLIQRLSDDVHIDFCPGGGTTVRIVKRISKE